MLTNTSFRLPRLTLTCSTPVQVTLVLSPSTALQPLPGFTATRSSTVTVPPASVIQTRLVLPLPALKVSLTPETEATPVAAACAGAANTPTAAVVLTRAMPALVSQAVRDTMGPPPYEKLSSKFWI